MSENLVELPDSSRVLPAGAQRVRDVDPDEPLSVTVYVRRDPAAPSIVDPAAEAEKPPAHRRYLTPAEVERSFGASDADLQRSRTTRSRWAWTRASAPTSPAA